MSKALLATFIALFMLPTWASVPGQPMDCDDWVILEPGLCSATGATIWLLTTRAIS